MDNQPRMPPGNVAEHDHGHMSWLDTCAQAALSAQVLVSVNDTLGNPWPVEDLREELAERLTSDLRLAEGHGVRRYPFGAQGLVTLASHCRSSASEPPVIDAESSVPLSLDLRRQRGSETVRLAPGRPVRHVAQGGSR